MALSTTVTEVGTVAGAAPNHQVFIQNVTVAADSAYPTGGTVGFTTHIRKYLTKFDTRAVKHVEGWGVLAGVLYLAKYDATNDKLLMYLASTGAQVSNSTDLSSMTLNLTIWSQ